MSDTSSVITAIPLGTNASSVYIELTYAEHFEKWASENKLSPQPIVPIDERPAYRVTATPNELTEMIEPWISSLKEY